MYPTRNHTGIACGHARNAGQPNDELRDLTMPTMVSLNSSAAADSYRQILGVRFFTGSLEEAVALGLRGGLVVAPAAPNMSALATDPATCEALLEADMVLTDSGLMVLLWNWLQGERIPRISGLRYLKQLLREPEMRQPGSVCWVMPNEASKMRNIAWLQQRGFPVTEKNFYVAPMYGRIIDDPALIEWVKSLRPAHIIMGLGGGTQERLGLYLRSRLDYRPGIHCIGAAIGFLTGDQVPIPDWADRSYLGWLLRCLSDPFLYVPRYWRAGGLVWRMIKYRDRMPAE
jgi:N-acetylglucosaminyldiphosphoundecaprenol N-acetyl-beta-D-mannosaminyltransferase